MAQPAKLDFPVKDSNYLNQNLIRKLTTDGIFTPYVSIDQTMGMNRENHRYENYVKYYLLTLIL
jgi:hypothetical protein